MSLNEASALAPQPTNSLRQPTGFQRVGLKVAKSTDFNMFGKDGFTFFDLLDIINPLQHIPGVSFLYRKITGDTIDPGSRIIGGTILGGPIGAVANLGDVMLQHKTGEDLAETAASFFLGKEQREDTNLASAQVSSKKGHLKTEEFLDGNKTKAPIQNNGPNNTDHHGMSAIPISVTNDREVKLVSRDRNDPPPVFASKNFSVIDKINLETKFLEQQAVLARRPETNPVSQENQQGRGKSGSRSKANKTFENSMLNALQKYHATIKLAEPNRLGYEALKIAR